MSLSRAFTTRGRRNTKPTEIVPPVPQRSLTTKHAFPAGTIRHKISAPVVLLSTTNMLSYNAPDIFPKSATSSTSSTTSGRSSNSDDDSDRSLTSPESPISSTGGSMSGSIPSSPEPNHLSCYFGSSNSGDESAPKIPQRAPSHTKKNAEIIARHRSASRKSSPKNSISTVRSSINMFTANMDATEQPEQHPFGNELAQVSELAEDYGISKETLAVVSEEEQELVSRGLFKFRAEDYMSEIQGFFQTAFGDAKTPMASSMWI
ncbi:hypothetical protein LSUE1_G006487 [Lachnellula suecica]|uniref:Uncharacterized protein n=1 Tax=Lachnellula suecica TaxID=602035 RepID=A0A8T9CAJ8_9HELO|nr:hypothetical protein LSUE1_G006487 [Lachnellula suecica]